MNALLLSFKKNHLNLCPSNNSSQLAIYERVSLQFVLCRFLDSAEHIANSQSCHLAYDKNRYANNEAIWYSLHFF